MTVSADVDTTILLTILGVIAAVWALIPQSSRLQFRFCVSWLDWFFGISVLTLVHYLVFAPTLQKLGLFYSFGPWRWGLNTSSVVYLLLLAIAVYFFWRTRSPRLVKGKIRIFHDLIENLLFTKRHAELVFYIDPQLSKLIRICRDTPWLVRVIDRINAPSVDLAALMRSEKPVARRTWRQNLRKALTALRAWVSKHDDASFLARETLQNLVTSPELINYIAVTHPFFALKLLKADEAIRSDFIEECVDAMLETPGSRLYVELKNNRNLNRGSRLALPESNRLLRHFFANATDAVNNGLYQAIGDAVFRRLDEDSKLAIKLNKELGSYSDSGRFRCPINSGITMFEIMVHEGIHQGLQDHMWLHYFRHFVQKIIKQMPSTPVEDSLNEWPTPFHYLLYRLISITSDWSLQSSFVDDSEIPETTKNIKNFDRHFISKEATKSLGDMLQIIIPSEKISDSFKRYLLSSVLRSHNELQATNGLGSIAGSLRNSVIRGVGIQTRCAYRAELMSHFQRLDHRLRMEANLFESDLLNSISECLTN
jgi:hypothetical protein